MDGIVHYALKTKTGRRGDSGGEMPGDGPELRPARGAGRFTVGLARAMTFYEHGRLWQNFFTLLGCAVVVSPETNRRILDNGVARCSNETCLPVKVLAGHVLELDGKCDVVFIPRYMSTARHELCCPKLCGLPDLMRLGLRGCTEIAELVVDADRGEERTEKTLESLSKRLGAAPGEVRAAYEHAVKNQLNADARFRLASDMEVGSLSKQKTVAVLGHPYMLYDRFLSMNLIGKLKAAGLNVVTPDSLGHEVRVKHAYPFYDERNFYGIGDDNLGCAYACAKRPEVAGMVYLTPFACGVDSLVTEFIERRLGEDREVPLMVLTVDEHTGEAGFDTRIEAFLDMLSVR